MVYLYIFTEITLYSEHFVSTHRWISSNMIYETAKTEFVPDFPYSLRWNVRASHYTGAFERAL